MSRNRSGAAAAALNGKIYVVGGEDGHRCVLCDAERYDPSTNTWTTIKGLNTPRYNPSLVLACGRLFVLDGTRLVGMTDEVEQIKSVEMYDVQKDVWIEKAPMTQSAKEVFIGVIPIPASITTPNLDDFNWN
ncbi:hypothetical protein PMAYCL1PPCAC_13896 [Pristionchus mayeri]|uniref:Uncharacterized protein n=1 Tax=Pristionchus mayeri TaxID=1317129 RepID=A0AAN5CHD6_9BILA|nr:hypothetical protein PMAYCL1PPCAC_13896 [Pristionchus mayeri]